MRTALLIISVIASLFFAVSFVLTFFAHGYIKGLAQDYVIDKTRTHAEPLVQIAEQALNARGIQLLLNEEQLQTARREIAAYRDDPRAYIAKLVAGDGRPAPAVAPGPNAPFKDQVLHWKVEIRKYFDDTLGRLLRDLRIFFGTNIVAAMLAHWFAWRARGHRSGQLLLLSGLLLASMAFGIYMYIDDMSYFRILMGFYMRWWYPALVAMLFLGMVIDFRKPLEAANAT
jgi:hypothetical protein